RRPAETDVIQLIRANPSKVQARPNGIRGKSRVVFQPADPLFRNGKEQFAVAHYACRRVMQLRIINPQSQHFFVSFFRRRLSSHVSFTKRFFRASRESHSSVPPPQQSNRQTHLVMK